jgi:thioredoxin 1
MKILIIVSGILLFVLIILFILARRKINNLSTIPASDKILTLTDATFSQKIKKGVVLVDFWAGWCMPCKLMIPVLNELASAVDSTVTIGKVDVDEATIIAGKYKIRSIPTLVLFKDGKEIDRFVGVKTKDYLLKELIKKSAG